MKYIMCSRHFLKGHPHQGKPTWFIEKVLKAVMQRPIRLDLISLKVRDLINDFWLISDVLPKHHTIRAGSRFKPGETVSLRVWSGKPRRSKQIEFAQVEVKKTWDVEIYNQGRDIKINGEFCEFDRAKSVAKNDGLEWADFVNWFNIHPKKKCESFRGQIICWNESIEYSKPSLVTEKQNNE